MIDRDALGEAMARADEYDYCHERVRDWEALPQWERDAQPQEEPFTDREQIEWWGKLADAAIAHFETLPKPKEPTLVVRLFNKFEAMISGNAEGIDVLKRLLILNSDVRSMTTYAVEEDGTLAKGQHLNYTALKQLRLESKESTK